MINLTLLGSGGGMPMPNRHLSSMIINYKGRKILIDCGEGTQVAMRKFHTGFKSIDIICITHFHGDHIFGLPGLLSTIGNSHRTEPITIIGPIGLKAIVKGLLVSIPYLPYDIKLIEACEEKLYLSFSSKILQVEEDNGKREDIISSTLELDHSSTCLGYSFYIPRLPKFDLEKAIENKIPKEIWSKLQKGNSMVYEGKSYGPDLVFGEKRKGIRISYITDTRPIDEISEFILESDLFICEGTYGADEDLEKAIKNKHMTFKEAAELAYKGKVKELLLTHFSPVVDNTDIYKENASKIFKNVIIGYDGYNKVLTYEDNVVESE